MGEDSWALRTRPAFGARVLGTRLALGRAPLTLPPPPPECYLKSDCSCLKRKVHSSLLWNVDENVPFVLANQELGTVSQVQSDQGCCLRGFTLVAEAAVPVVSR